ncbi:MAG: 50S ribosomal protein L13 [Rickettsiales bacterium]|nr:50S ribosomal protein L13 [Rickettsiales bacterium]
MKSFSANPKELERKWYLIDATDLVLGRMAVIVADILRGKNKPIFTPNQDCGDFVVIINANKVYMTGHKYEDKKYIHHTDFPGGLKETTAKKIMTGKFPERIIEQAIETMITRNALGREVMRKLFVYSGSKNPHSAQKPELLDVKAMSPKNSKRN